MSAQLDYQGVTKKKTNDGTITSETYIGSQADIESFASGKKCGATSSYGSLQTIQVSQGDGPYWKCTLEWSTEIDSNGNEIGTGTLSAAKQSTLSIRMMSMPLESHKQYKMNWNHILIGLGSASVPGFWSSATIKDSGISEANAKKYRWINQYSEIPLEKTDGKTWHVLKEKTKPGVESYDYPVYELSEVSKHNSKSSAGWAISKKIGKITSPSNGDFGVTSKNGGNWLCEGGSISYNDKHWIAQCTYVHSPDGWDKDLYNS